MKSINQNNQSVSRLISLMSVNQSIGEIIHSEIIHK